LLLERVERVAVIILVMVKVLTVQTRFSQPLHLQVAEVETVQITLEITAVLLVVQVAVAVVETLVHQQAAQHLQQVKETQVVTELLVLASAVVAEAARQQ
jgi:hypothetical protein